MIVASKPLYPGYSVKRLRKRWGSAWRHLVDYVMGLSPVHPKALAFTLMMRRLRELMRAEAGGSCEQPSCALCATDLLAHFAGSERDLLEEYYRTLDEVKGFLAGQPKKAVARVTAY